MKTFSTWLEERNKITEGNIDLSKPSGSERVRDFQPPYRTVFKYNCPDCGKEVKVRANSFMGKTAVPGKGAISCPHCSQSQPNQ
jgi:DNA-directed RNA polymerase subunit RPC12/RpoP